MLCDLNVLFPNEISKSSINQLERVLITLIELKYTHVAINKQLTPSMYQNQSGPGQKKKSGNNNQSNKPEYELRDDLNKFFECFHQLEHKFSASLKLFARCTVEIDEPSKIGGVFITINGGVQNADGITNKFDLISVLPLSEKGLIYLTSNSKGDVDILTFDYSNYFNGFHLKHKTMNSLAKKGIKIELVYSPLFSSSQQAIKFIANSKQVIRTCRNGTNSVLISSGATTNLHVRNKLGVHTMLKFLGLKSHIYSRMMNENPGLALLNGRLRLKSYQQVVTAGSDVVNGLSASGNEREINGFVVRSSNKRTHEELTTDDTVDEENRSHKKLK
ncbi:hypothetical protein ACO0QE_000542 [Hanseniaspora vineae]